MLRTVEFQDVARRWEETGRTLLTSSDQIRPLTASTVDERAEEVVARIESFLADGERLLKPLANETTTDTEAFLAATAVIRGTLAVGGSLDASADDPDQIIEVFGLRTLGEFPAFEFVSEFEDAVGVIRGPQVSGAAATVETPLDDMLKRLRSAAGTELVAIGANVAELGVLNHVGDGVSLLLHGAAREAFEQIRTRFNLVMKAIKAAAQRAITWALDWVRRLLPEGVYDAIAAKAKELLANPSEIAGRIAAELAGVDATIEAWARATDAQRASASTQLDTVTHGELELISNVARIRKILMRLARWVAGVSKEAHVFIAALAIAAALIVLGALGHALNDIEELVVAA